MKVSSILAPTTDAANSTSFEVSVKKPTSVTVNDLAGVETATLQVSTDTQASWDNATDLDGNDIACTVDVNTFLVVGPGVYRVTKSATVAAVGVAIAQ
jgi:hypothetical protein